MSPATWGGRDRRAYQRYSVALAVESQVFARGFPPNRMGGTSINISRGGVLLRLENLVQEGARCCVTFEEAEEYMTPQSAAGKILYRRSQGNGEYAVVIQFDAPLSHVTGPGGV